MIDIVGIGADGSFVAPREVVTEASVIVGAPRHLELFQEDHRLSSTPTRTWPSPLRDQLQLFLDDLRARFDRIVVLASGDPLRSGIATRIIDTLGAGEVTVHPFVSSDTLARARMGWSAESCDVVTLVGRATSRLVPFLTPGARLVVLCSGSESPVEVARLLRDHGWGDGTVTAMWDLGAASEGSREASAEEWCETGSATPPLVLVCLALPDTPPTVSALGPAPGRADDAFDHDGLITKRDIRATALARLRPLPGQVMWDVGAGSGAIGLEWLLAAPRSRAVAIERRDERVARIRENAERFGLTHRLDVVVANTGDAVSDPALDDPDAIFLGGGLSDEVIATCLRRLRPGGRLVGHAVTLESETLLLAAWRRHGGELTRHSVETVTPLGTMSGWKPARSVVQWTYLESISR